MKLLPPGSEAHVRAAEAGDTSPAARRRALAALLPGYTGARWLLLGTALWAGVVAAVLLAAVGTMSVLGVLVAQEPWPWLLAGVLALLGAAGGGAWAVRRALEMLRAGRRLGRAVETWLRATPEVPDSLATRLHTLGSALRPEILPRTLLIGLSGLAAVLLASIMGFVAAQLAEPGLSPMDLASLVVLGAASVLLAVVCAVVAVAMWRGARCIQRGLEHDPSVRR